MTVTFTLKSALNAGACFGFFTFVDVSALVAGGVTVVVAVGVAVVVGVGIVVGAVVGVVPDWHTVTVTLSTYQPSAPPQPSRPASNRNLRLSPATAPRAVSETWV